MTRLRNWRYHLDRFVRYPGTIITAEDVRRALKRKRAEPCHVCGGNNLHESGNYWDCNPPPKE